MSEPTTALAVRTTFDVDDAAAARRATQFLKHRGGAFPSDLTEGQATALARLSLLYGLDPLADELIIYQGKPYLTITGAVRVANEHKQYDGLECEPATPAEREAFRARDDDHLWVCRVWRKDRRVPTVGYGRCSEQETTIGRGGELVPNLIARKWTQEMAQKRSKHRALRDAFSLPIASVSGGDADDVQGAPERVVARVVEPGESGPEPVGADQLRAIHAIARAVGWITPEDDHVYRDCLQAMFGIRSSAGLTRSQAAAFIEALAAEQETLLVDDDDIVDQRLTLAERANEVGMTTLQLQGLIEAQYGTGTTINSLGAPQIVTLMELLAIDDAPIEEQTAELKW